MLSLIAQTLSDLKKACKKATDTTWGKDEMAQLTTMREELEDLQVDSDFENLKKKLVEAAQVLRKAKKLLLGNKV